MSNNAKQKLEAAMQSKGVNGIASVEWDAPTNMTLKFTRDDGERCGVQVGGTLSKTRTEDDLVALAANKMCEWYARDAE